MHYCVKHVLSSVICLEGGVMGVGGGPCNGSERALYWV